MKALLLAAGFGTRLRPLTDKMPKCLVPIKGKPLLQIWIERLSEADNGPFLINTHYLEEQVQEFVEGSTFKERVKLVHEKELLGTAGTLISNIGFFRNGDMMLIHADNYCLANFKEFIEAHNSRPQYCLMTMLVFKSNNPSSCGIVELDNHGVVLGFHEKVADPPGNLANGAVYILSPQLLDLIESEFRSISDISTQLLPSMVGRIYTYETSETFIDIGTPQTYNEANSN